MAFRSEEKLKDHKILCEKSEEGNVKMPDTGSFIDFKGKKKTMKFPMMMVADTESILIDIDEKYGKGTNRYQKHQMISYCILVQYINDKGQNKLVLKSYRASDDKEDVAVRFVKQVEKLATKLSNIKENKTLVMTMDDWENYNLADVCWVCGGKFGGEGGGCVFKVRDHDHYTGKYRGAPHRDCNLQIKKPNFVPVIFHNGSGYDFHLIVEALAKTGGKIKVIP